VNLPLLRRPTSSSEKVADAVLLLGLLGLPVAAAGWGLSAIGTLAIPTLALGIPRALALKPALQAAFGMAMLIASWSIILDLYASWTHWDLAVHAALNGLIAAVGVSLLTRIGALPSIHALPAQARPSTNSTRLSLTVLTTMFGVTCGVLWEFFEWTANELFGAALFVSYTDTLGDIAVGALGAALAGYALGVRPRDQRPSMYGERSTNKSSMRTM
jgi:hypothetical protein